MTIEEQVAAYLQEIGVTYTATHIGAAVEDNWEHDIWKCKLANEVFDFKTGLGHRAPPNAITANRLQDKFGYRYKQTQEWKEACKPTPPKAASVLYSLLLDAESASETFDDWCENFGYDTDSRKALETYLLCQNISSKLRKIFKPEQLAHLKTLLEDY